MPGGLALRAVERPVASRNAGVVAKHDGAREHVNGELVDPLVVVAFVELIAVGRVTEKSGPLANLWTDGIVESAESSWTKFVPVCPLELVKHSRLLLDRSRYSRNSIDSLIRNSAFKATELTASTSSLVTKTVSAIEASIAIAASKSWISIATIESSVAIVTSKSLISIATI